MTSPTPPPRPRRSHRLRERGRSVSTATGGWKIAPLVLVLIAACLIAWSTTRGAESAAPPPAATQLPLGRSDLTCPSVDTAKLKADRTGIGFTTPSTDAAKSDAGQGTVEVTPIPHGDSLTPRRAPAVGDWEVVSQDADAAKTVFVSTTGSLAAGSSAFTATSATDEAGGGAAVGACARPGREAWFVGAGSSIDHASTLLVSNPGDTEAIADVTLLSRNGSSNPVSGLVVKPRHVVRIGLAEVAAGEGEVAVRVAASQGQVATAVLDTWTATLQPAGTEWVPTAQAPATSLTVSPLIGGADRRALIVGNPSDRTASVKIQVVGPDGTFPVAKFEDISVDPESVKLVDVPSSLDKQTVALKLDSDQPVVASVRSISPGSPADVAYGTSLAEISGPAVVPVDLPTVDASGLRLLVSGADPSHEAKFTVTAYSASGSSLSERSETVPAGSVVDWQADSQRDLGAKLSKVAYLVVRPDGGGQLLASATYSSGDSAWAAMPLAEAPVTVTAPGVYPLG